MFQMMSWTHKSPVINEKPISEFRGTTLLVRLNKIMHMTEGSLDSPKPGKREPKKLQITSQDFESINDPKVEPTSWSN